MITIKKNDGSVQEIASSGASSENMQDVAAPASTDTGVNVQDAADPAIATDTATGTVDVTSDMGDDAGDSIFAQDADSAGSITQDSKTNAKYAAARRAAEKQRDEGIAAAKAEAEATAKAKIESFIEKMGLRGPDGNIIKTEEEYADFIARRDGEKSKEKIEEQTGLSSDKVDELISSHPDVAAAREAQANAKAVSDALNSERAQKAIDDEVTKVREAFPEVQSIDDIVRLPRYPQIKDKVSAGYSLSDAVKLTYEDTYIKRRSAAAAQQAKNAVNSTAHLSGTRSHGSGGVNVTEAQIKTYMATVPGSTRADAIAAYQKYKIQRK